MYDMELDRKKCQREVWMRQGEYINLKIKAGLRVRDILTEIPTEELSKLLEYAIKGIEQELKEMDEADERQEALDVIDKFIQSRNATIDFLPDKTHENHSEWLSHFVHNVNYRLSFNDWMKLEEIRAALQTKSEKTSLSSTSSVRDALSSQTEAACAVRVPVIEILDTVLEQAEDDGLWFNAKHASEAYLQQELRRLHAVIERAYAELSKTQEPSPAPPQKGV